jgi:autotransporter-associated beta strand protein
MNPRSIHRFLAAALFALPAAASAAIAYFDANGATSGFGSPNGITYTMPVSDWTSDSTGGTAPVAWLNGSTMTFGATYGGTDSFSGATFTIRADTQYSMGGLTINSANATVTLTSVPGSPSLGDFYLSKAQTWTVAAGSTLNESLAYNNVGNNMAGAALTLAGGGTINITTALGYNSTGLITQNGDSTLVVNLNAAAPPAAFSGGFTLTAGRLNFATAASANAFKDFGSKQFTINGGTLDNTSGSAMTLTAASGGYSLGGNFTFAGSSDLNFGTQAVALTGTRQISVTQNKLTVGGVISGSTYGLTKAGAGTLALTGANTYTGTTTVNEGILNLGIAESVNASGPMGKQLANAAGTIALTGGTLQYSSVNNTDYSGRFSTAASQKYNVDTNGRSVTWATALNSSGGTLTKSGSGTLTLSNTNSYGGTTTVGAGTLKLDGAGSIASSAKILVGNTAVTDAVLDVSSKTGGFTVGGTQTLGGTGSVSGAVAVSSGGIHTAGDAVTVANTSGTGTIGKETFSTGLTYNQGSIFEWNLTANADTLNGTRGINYDAVNTAALAKVGTGGIFRVVLNGGQAFTESFWTTTRNWTDVFRNADDTGASTNTLASIFSTVEYANASGLLVSAPTTGAFSMTDNTLTWTAVPEPSSALAGILLVSGLLRRRRSNL